MYLRKAKPENLDQIAAVEAACFPPAEAASRDQLEARLARFPDCYWIGFDEYGTITCYAGGMPSDGPDLTDEMYADPSLCDPKGDWLMIFSVCTMPEFRRQGVGAWLLNRVISDAESSGRQGVVLTCKEEMVHYYAKFGFVNEGVSSSTHGGARWYQMRITFDEDYMLEHLFCISDDPEENRRFLEEAIWGRAF